MHDSNPPIPNADIEIARTEPNGSLLEGDRLVYQTRHHLAPAESRVGPRQVGIGGDHRLKLRDSLFVPPLCHQNYGFDKVCKRVSGRYQQRHAGAAQLVGPREPKRMDRLDIGWGDDNDRFAVITCAYRLCHPNIVPMETAEPSD